MEISKNEVRTIEKTITEAEQMQTQELNDLQLACVGGGIGDVVVN